MRAGTFARLSSEVDVDATFIDTTAAMAAKITAVGFRTPYAGRLASGGGLAGNVPFRSRVVVAAEARAKFPSGCPSASV